MGGRKEKENRKEENNGKEKSRNANNLILGIRLDKAPLFCPVEVHLFWKILLLL